MSTPPVIPEDILPFDPKLNHFERGTTAPQNVGPGYALRQGWSDVTETLTIPKGTVLYTCIFPDKDNPNGKLQMKDGCFYGSNPVVALWGSKAIKGHDGVNQLKQVKMYAVQFPNETIIPEVKFQSKSGGNREEMRISGQHIAHYEWCPLVFSDPQLLELALRLPETTPKVEVNIATDANVYKWMAEVASAQYANNFWNLRAETAEPEPIQGVWPLLARSYLHGATYPGMFDGTLPWSAREASTAMDDLTDAVHMLPHLALKEFYSKPAMGRDVRGKMVLTYELFRRFEASARERVPAPLTEEQKEAELRRRYETEYPWPIEDEKLADKEHVGKIFFKRVRNHLPMPGITTEWIRDHVVPRKMERVIEFEHAAMDIWLMTAKAYPESVYDIMEEICGDQAWTKEHLKIALTKLFDNSCLTAEQVGTLRQLARIGSPVATSSFVDM